MNYSGLTWGYHVEEREGLTSGGHARTASVHFHATFYHQELPALMTELPALMTELNQSMDNKPFKGASQNATPHQITETKSGCQAGPRCP